MAVPNVNEGALGAFRVQMRMKPQLTMTNYNALAMFEHNNTQNFMNALFTEPGDFKFLRGQARAYKGKDQPNTRKWFYVNKKKMRSERRLQINGRKQQHNEKRKLRNFSWSWTRIGYRRW
jgi:hypothetical protein